jgi:CRP-like cAMP-binding protein
MTIAVFIKQHLPGFEKGDFVLPFEVEENSFAKGCVVTDYGDVENKLFLLSQGLVQISTLKGEQERILEFVFSGEFFSAYTSFLLQEPSDVQIKTLQPCKVSIIKRENLLQANQVSLISNHLSLHVAQRLFLSRARREKDFLTLSAEERYHVLLEKDPDIVLQIPGNKIASYLGIEPESLSRIRKSIIP